MKTLFLLPISVATCLFACATTAQTTSDYTSPIADYQKFVDEKITPWKAANDNVGQIGGWRAYAKEAQQPSVATPANAPVNAPTNASASMPTNKPPELPFLSAEIIAKQPLPVRLAWLHTIAKHAQLSYAKQTHAAAQASSELARRMRSVGNMTRLQQAQQHAVYAETATLLLTSAQEAADAREVFVRAMGLSDAQARELALADSIPDRLPDLPPTPIDESALSRIVRLKNTQLFAPEEPSQLRSSYATYRNAYALAKHYRDAVLPLQNIIAEETTLRYNGMFIGVFDLLTQSREHSKMVMASMAATLAFWQAEAAFQHLYQTQLRTISAE